VPLELRVAEQRFNAVTEAAWPRAGPGMERGGHTSREVVDWLAAALGTVDLMGRALGLPRAIPPLSWLGISSDGLVVTLAWIHRTSVSSMVFLQVSRPFELG
jgi:hypothetical protein